MSNNYRLEYLKQIDELKYFIFKASSEKDAKKIASKARQIFGEGYKRGDWVIIGPIKNEPSEWLNNICPNLLEVYSGDTPEEAAKKADIRFKHRQSRYFGDYYSGRLTGITER